MDYCYGNHVTLPPSIRTVQQADASADPLQALSNQFSLQTCLSHNENEPTAPEMGILTHSG